MEGILLLVDTFGNQRMFNGWPHRQDWKPTSSLVSFSCILLVCETLVHRANVDFKCGQGQLEINSQSRKRVDWAMPANVPMHMAWSWARGKREGSSGREVNCPPNPCLPVPSRVCWARVSGPLLYLGGTIGSGVINGLWADERHTSFLGWGGKEAAVHLIPFPLQELNAKNFEAQGVVPP